MKKLGVIILNWNGINLLKQFIPIASRYTISETSDLIVADNGSTDNSVEWLRIHHPEVKLIELPENYGFAEGYNRAIEACDYEYVVLLNSDVEVTEGWWQPMLQFMEENPGIGALQPKIMAFHNRNSFEYAGAAGGMLDNLGFPYCRGRILNKIEVDRGQYDDTPADIVWASGACLMTRRDIYLRVGGLDARFFAHMEEIDLCCRILNAGYRVCFIPDAKVYHVGGASLSQGNPKKTYLNFRNNLLLLHKNLPQRIGARKLFIRRLVDTLAFCAFCAKLDFKNAHSIIKAHNDFRQMRKHYTQFPAHDILSRQPGANKSVFLLRLRAR